MPGWFTLKRRQVPSYISTHLTSSTTHLVVIFICAKGEGSSVVLNLLGPDADNKSEQNPTEEDSAAVFIFYSSCLQVTLTDTAAPEPTPTKPGARSVPAEDDPPI